MSKTSITNKKVLFFFNKITPDMYSDVGHVAAQLSQISSRKKQGYSVPTGFVISHDVWKFILHSSDVRPIIKKQLKRLDATNKESVKEVSRTIQKAITSVDLPAETQASILEAVESLQKVENTSLAIRSSAIGYTRMPQTAIHESFLHVTSKKRILSSIKKCLASLYSEKALVYREVYGIDHLDVAMAVIVQHMAPSSIGGILQTQMNTPTRMSLTAQYGFYGAHSKDIEADVYTLFRPGIQKKLQAVVSKQLGAKKHTIVTGKTSGVKAKATIKKKQNTFCVSDELATRIARMGLAIEKQFGSPVSIKWSYDAKQDSIAILAVKPLKQHTQEDPILETFILKKKGTVVVEGRSVGYGIFSGKVHKVSQKKKKLIPNGSVLVAARLDASHEEIIKKCGAIIVEQAGDNQYAAIIAKERRIPCIVGAKKAIELLKNNAVVTLDCSLGLQGTLYKGALPFEVKKTTLSSVADTKAHVQLHITNAYNADALADMPVQGVGIIAQDDILEHVVRVHPLAAHNYKKLKNKSLKKQIVDISVGFRTPKEYVVYKMAEAIAQVATAFYPKQVMLKLSEHPEARESVLGASLYDLEDPMWFGADRYITSAYKPAFKMECEALQKAREEWGCSNIAVTIPYASTPDVVARVLAAMEKYGLKRGKSGVHVEVECDIPAHLMLSSEYSALCDGISLSRHKEESIDYNNQVFKKMLKQVIDSTHKQGKSVTLSQSDLVQDKKIVQTFLTLGVDTFATTSDNIIPLRNHISYIEGTVGNTGQKTNGKLLGLVMACAVFAAGFMSMGAGCSTLTGAPIAVESESYEVTPAQMREQITKHVEEQVQAEKQAERSHMKVSSFVEVEFDYPIGWDAEHFVNGLSVQDPHSDEYFSVFVQIMDHPVNYTDSLQIGDSNARYAVVDNVHIVEVEVGGRILEINGKGPHFREIVESIILGNKELSINALINHWDVREQRLCADMATFARPTKESGQCTLYTNSCDVPDGYHVCTSDDL